MTAIHTDTPSKSPLKQIDSIQVLRAVAVIQVIWTHAGQELAPFTARSLPDFGVFGIDIFFVISGFIMSSIVLHLYALPGRTTAWSFLKRRLTRILPLYWIMSALFLRGIRHTGLHLATFLPDFFLLPFFDYPRFVLILGVSWTLIFEMFFYYAFTAVLLLTVRNAVQALITALCTCVLLGEVLGLRRPDLLIMCNPILLEFVLGAAIALLYARLGQRKLAGWILTISGIIAAIALQILALPVANGLQMIVPDVRVFSRVSTWGFAATLLVAGALFWSPQPKNKLWSLAIVLGSSSYSAYLVSVFIIEYALRALLRLHQPVGSRLHFTYQAAIVAAVLVVGWLVYQFIEWPLVRSMQRISFLNGRPGPKKTSPVPPLRV